MSRNSRRLAGVQRGRVLAEREGSELHARETGLASGLGGIARRTTLEDLVADRVSKYGHVASSSRLARNHDQRKAAPGQQPVHSPPEPDRLVEQFQCHFADVLPAAAACRRSTRPARRSCSIGGLARARSPDLARSSRKLAAALKRRLCPRVRSMVANRRGLLRHQHQQAAARQQRCVQGGDRTAAGSSRYSSTFRQRAVSKVFSRP